MEEIANELLKTIKYIPERERNSKWYKEYLEKVHKDLLTELNKL
jgi:hypothetical protein